MSISLRISLPKRPYRADNPIRFQYRAVFDSGREISLPALAKQLGFAYITLFEAIRYSGMSLGTHTDQFMKVLASVRAKRKRSHTSKWHKCPTCHGRGRMPNDLPDR